MRVAKAAVFLLVASLFLVSAPGGQAQIQNPNVSTPTTLYFHIFDTFNKFPINTQMPDVEFFEVGGTSFPTIASQGYDFNTIYGYSTAGPVEYDFIENGRPRFHPERGIASDVSIDASVQPTLYFYIDVRDFFSTSSLGGPICEPPAPCVDGSAWEGAPNALPSFTVRATMREGDDIGADLDSGAIIMSGEMTAHIVDGQTVAANDAFAGQTGPDGHPVYVPDESGFVEFAIPLQVGQNIIRASEAFNLRIDWFQNPGGLAEDDEYAEGYMRLGFDADHLPRLEMNINNPVYISFIHPQVAAGQLLIHTGVNSPWGTYDVDAKNISLTVSGPSAPQTLQQVVAQNQHVHGLHHLDAEITYLWPFRSEEAANGEYTIRMEVPNQAGTSTAKGQATFIIEGKKTITLDDQGEEIEEVKTDDGNQDSPGAGLLLIAPMLAALAAVIRRRRA